MIKLVYVWEDRQWYSVPRDKWVNAVIERHVNKTPYDLNKIGRKLRPQTSYGFAWFANSFNPKRIIPKPGAEVAIAPNKWSEDRWFVEAYQYQHPDGLIYPENNPVRESPIR